MSRCEHDPTCHRPAELLHTFVHADCRPGLTIGVTVAACELHAYTRSESLRRLYERTGATTCVMCGLDVWPVVRIEPVPEWSLT